MALSDHEEQILKQIEAGIRKSDPDLAQHVEQTNIYRYSGKRIALSVFALLVLLGIIIATFTNAFPVAFVAFGLMVLVGISLANHLVKIGRAGVDEAREYARKSSSTWQNRDY